MAYEALMSTVGGVALILADLRRRATRSGGTTPPPPEGSDVVLSSFSAPNPVNYGTQTGVPYNDTTSTVHSIGYRFVAGRNTADFVFNMTDANTGNAFRLDNDNKWSFGQWSNGSFSVDNSNNFVDFTLESGAMLEARVNSDGTAGLYQGDKLASRLIAGTSLRTPRGKGVALVVTVGPAVDDVTYGAINPELFVRDPDFDPFTRTLSIDANYANHNGAVPDYAEISLNGRDWLRARNALNPAPGRATIALDNVAIGISGEVAGRVRWHNNPEAVRAFRFEAVLPFGGVFGMNSSADEAQAFNDNGGFELYASDANRTRDGRSIAPLNGFGVVPSSADGQGGTVQRSLDGAVGINTLGITHYRFFREFRADATTIGDYEMFMAPGVEVMQESFTLLPNFAYNKSTGHVTFSLTDTTVNTIIGLYAQVNTIPDGTLLRPTFRKVDAVGKYNPTAVALQKSMADVDRNMDGSGINNANNATRTITALPRRTASNSGSAQYVGDLEYTKALGRTKYIAINSHIDDESYVKAHADYMAANIPVGWNVWVSNFNELWNFIFTHFYDMMLGGARAGYGPEGATTANAVPITVLDAGSAQATGGTLFINCDASGVVQSNPDLNTSIKTARALTAGDLFLRNVGGVVLLRAKVNVPVGTITNDLRLRDSQDPNYEYAQDKTWSIRAGLRYASTLAKRNILIWKASFAAANRTAPKFLLEGRVADASYAFPMLDWDGLAEHIDYNTSAPYISGGFSFDYMDWDRTDIWDASARQLIANSDYKAAIELIIPKAITKLPEMGASMRAQQAAQRTYNISKFGTAGKDRIGQYFYEYGDHFGFVDPNWPDVAKARAFWNAFRAHPLYYTFFTAYLEELARIGAPANWYRGGVGLGSFNMFKTLADTDTSGGPATNWRYKAVRDMAARVRAAVAAYSS